MRIYNLGSLNVDYVYSVPHFVTAGETLSPHTMQTFPGGKGLNQSVALAKAGAKVLHGGLVGENGAFLRNTLESAGVDCSRVETVKGACGHAIIQLDGHGQNSILLYPGANHQVDEAYARRFLSDARPGDILLLQNEVSALPEIFAIAREKGLQIAFNPSPYEDPLKKLPLSDVKWWFCNEIEGAALFGSDEPEKIVENFVSLYPQSHLILTLGGAGSLYAGGGAVIRQDIFKVKAVDTTGAGDCFMGYFMASVAAGKPPADALELASKASAIVVSRPGAAVSIPTLDEVIAYWK